MEHHPRPVRFAGPQPEAQMLFGVTGIAPSRRVTAACASVLGWLAAAGTRELAGTG